MQEKFLGLLLITTAASAFTMSAEKVFAQEAKEPGLSSPAIHEYVTSQQIGLNEKDSSPLPARPPLAVGKPNVLIIMTDDVGYGASSTFGGPISTPAFDDLANNGLRYNRFHTTAVCSATRAALLTGRNHHSVNVASVIDMSKPYPGYDGKIPRSSASLAKILTVNGYSTAAFGKWHLTPLADKTAAGPFDQWPTGMGFQHFYGFLGGDTLQWTPDLYDGTTPIEPYQGVAGYHLDADLADQAIKWIRNVRTAKPNTPFFLYYATGTAHAPHQAPRDWIQRYRGKFDQGWDRVREESFARQKRMGVVPQDARLTERPKEIPAWDSLSSDQKRVYARMMEVYAGALSYADYNIGRVIKEIKDEHQIDNTLIFYIQGDNGASGEGGMNGSTNEVATISGTATNDIPYLLSIIDELGGPKAMNNYPAGWAWATNAPFKWMKQIASHLGGMRNGMVVSWPDGIKSKGGIRSQFTHVVDIAPTVLDATKVTAPLEIEGVTQKPLDGISFSYSFDQPSEPERHNTQYFEMFGNRAIYHKGWLANTKPTRVPWMTVGGGTDNPALDFTWELYNLDHDFTQSDDLSLKQPKKLQELQALWWAEAGKNNVLPIANSLNHDQPKPSAPWRVSYHQGQKRIPQSGLPALFNRSYSIIADIIVPEVPGDGMIATQGGRFDGWGLYILNGRPTFTYALTERAQDKFTAQAEIALPSGPHILRFDFAYDGGKPGSGGVGTLSVDGKLASRIRIPRTAPSMFFWETFDVGTDTGTPISDLYEDKMPFTYSGTINNVTIDAK